MPDTYPPKWEYEKRRYGVYTNEPPLMEELNAMGAQGWEVCGFASDGLTSLVIFKRPVWPPTVTTDPRQNW